MTSDELDEFGGLKNGPGEHAPIAQATLMAALIDTIKVHGRHHEKCAFVKARPATPGEVVVSVTSDGKETENVANADQMLVENETAAKEHYLVDKDKFEQRYAWTKDVRTGWASYQPKGEVHALDIDEDVLKKLGVGSLFYIVAPWHSDQLCRLGDKFVAPVPGFDEIYRIAALEFSETYRPTNP